MKVTSDVTCHMYTFFYKFLTFIPVIGVSSIPIFMVYCNTQYVHIRNFKITMMKSCVQVAFACRNYIGSVYRLPLL